MTIRHEFKPCSLGHLAILARTMRAEDRAEIEGLGLDVRRTLLRLWLASAEPGCGLVDGDVAACFGDSAPLLSETGHLWLFTTPAIERVPLAYFREVRAGIAALLSRRLKLIADARADYTKTMRFFGLVGFKAGDEHEIGGHLYRQLSIERA